MAAAFEVGGEELVDAILGGLDADESRSQCKDVRVIVLRSKIPSLSVYSGLRQPSGPV